MDLAMMNRIMALIAQNEAQNAPPAYQPPKIADIIAQGAELPSCDPESKERLRRFLLFCLAVDYSLLKSQKLSQWITREEWLMWVRLGKVLHIKEVFASRTALDLHLRAWEDVEAIKCRHPTVDYELSHDPSVDQLEEIVDMYIVRPAFALGLSPELAVTMVRRYPFTLALRGGHMPVWHRHQKRCMKALASKFFLDKEFLIDALLPPGDETLVAFREALHAKNIEVSEKYFVTLITPWNYSLTPWAEKRNARERLYDRIELDPLSSMWDRHPVRGGIYHGLLKRLFAALPEEGKAREDPGLLERWTRRKAKLFLGRSD
ncbi:hypothetical protein BDV97DRAFT_371006 [Delphinella strobiligena]|nr:hypothetical protein BDV97DRAFT_371006 [Delphinella strobiligena]